MGIIRAIDAWADRKIERVVSAALDEPPASDPMAYQVVSTDFDSDAGRPSEARSTQVGHFRAARAGVSA